MSKINNHNHLKNLAQRKNHDKTLGDKPKTNDKDKDKNKNNTKKKDEDPKCSWNTILIILIKVTLLVFINYVIGASTIYYLSHKDIVHNLDKDYPVDLEAPPFCFYSVDDLNSDNKVLEENNKILAGHCGIIQQLKELFHSIIDAIKYFGEKLMEVFIFFKDFIVKTLPPFMKAVTTAAGAFGAMSPEPKDGSGSTSGNKSGKTTDLSALASHGVAQKGAKAHKAKSHKAKSHKHKGGSNTNTTAPLPHSGKEAGAAQPKPKPKPQPKSRTYKDIENKLKKKDCVGFKWSDDNLMFDNQQELGFWHIFDGPASLGTLRPSLSVVALAKYQTIMNGWLKWFINPLCSIITPETADNYYAKVALGMFSSLIMALFIVYFLVTHIFTTLQMFLAIIGPELGRYVASSSGTESTFYCLKENLSWILSKLIPLIYVPIVTTLFLFVPLLNSIWKFFIGPYLSNIVECNNILASIIVNIIFVWLSVLAYSYFTTFSSCPDNKIMKINDITLLPFKRFPLIFLAAAIPLYLYVLYRN